MPYSGHCCSLTIIIISATILLLSLFMTFGGYGLILRAVGLPIGLKLLPVNEVLMAWISIPLAISIKAKITEVSSLSAVNGSVGGGRLYVELEMSKWVEAEPEEGAEPPPKLIEFIHIQETEAIDEIQYYKATLSESILNYWNFFSWILVMAGVFAIGGGTAWKILSDRTAKSMMLDEK